MFSDRHKISLFLTTLFVVGIGLSLYFIYSLPNALRLSSGFENAFALVYGVLIITFAFGIAALVIALQHRNEIIVYRDRNQETLLQNKENESKGTTTVDMSHLLSIVNNGGSRDEMLEKALQAIAKEVDAGQGALYLQREVEGQRRIYLEKGYALTVGENTEISFEFGEGLLGQAVSTGTTLLVDDIPEGYIKIVSGLGSAYPKFLLIVPIRKNGSINGAIELASFSRITDDQKKFVEEAGKLIAEQLKNLQ